MANQVAYDSLQVHGGSGYMRDFAVERYARDARITNIYEGTTQLQVVAAIGGILGGTLAGRLDEYDAEDFAATPELLARVRSAQAHVSPGILRHASSTECDFRDFARRLAEMASRELRLSGLSGTDRRAACSRRVLRAAAAARQRRRPGARRPSTLDAPLWRPADIPGRPGRQASTARTDRQPSVRAGSSSAPRPPSSFPAPAEARQIAAGRAVASRSRPRR
jgi:hypothetical protein